ncbi:unnamed protein product [Victoria cruziana]
MTLVSRCEFGRASDGACSSEDHRFLLYRLAAVRQMLIGSSEEHENHGMVPLCALLHLKVPIRSLSLQELLRVLCA